MTMHLKPDPAPPAGLSDDLLWGAQEIAREIGRGEKVTYNMLERGELPAKKIGNRWVASKMKLREHFLN